MIAAELAVVAPDQCTRIYGPLSVKASFALLPPIKLIMKKANGSKTKLYNRRDVGIADFTAKAHGSELRSRLFGELKGEFVGTQHGVGLNGAECAVAHLAIEAAAHSALVCGHTSALILVDIASAFATVCKWQALPTVATDHQAAMVLKTLGCSDDEVRDILIEARSDPAV